MVLTGIKVRNLYSYLRRSASESKLVTYPDAGVTSGLPEYRKCFTHALAAISTDTYQKHGIVLTSIVVGKHTGTPAPEYFDFLRESLGITVPEDKQYQVWAQQVREAHKFFRVE